MKYLRKVDNYDFIQYDESFFYLSYKSGEFNVLDTDLDLVIQRASEGIHWFGSKKYWILTNEQGAGVYSVRFNKYIYQFDNLDLNALKILNVDDNIFFYRTESSIEMKNVSTIELIKGFNSQWKIENGGHIFFAENTLILTKKNKISTRINNNTFSRLDYHTGKKLWTFKLADHESKLKSQYPFDNPLMIKKTLGEYDGNIWFALNNGCVMAIDSDTGAFKHWIRDIEGNDEPWANGSGYYSILPETNKAVMDQDNGKLVFFLRWYYWVLDLSTLQVDFHNLKTYFEEVGYNPKSLIQLEGNSILSTDHSTRQFASFDRASLQFEWIEKVPVDAGLPTSIEKVNDKYYVKTNSTELLIYENDEANETEV